MVLLYIDNRLNKKRNNRMKIVFMGTPDFAVPSLKRLIEEYEVRSCIYSA